MLYATNVTEDGDTCQKHDYIIIYEGLSNLERLLCELYRMGISDTEECSEIIKGITEEISNSLILLDIFAYKNGITPEELHKPVNTIKMDDISKLISSDFLYHISLLKAIIITDLSQYEISVVHEIYATIKSIAYISIRNNITECSWKEVNKLIISKTRKIQKYIK